MKEYRKIFVICRKDGDIEYSDNYCKHGPMGEMEDAIGYRACRQQDVYRRR